MALLLIFTAGTLYCKVRKYEARRYLQRTKINGVLAYLMVHCAMLMCMLVMVIKAAHWRSGSAVTTPGASLALPVDIYCRQLRVGFFHRSLALLIVFTGMAGRVSTPNSDATSSFCMDLHPVFGLLLLAFVASRFYWHLNVPRVLRRTNMQQFSLRLGRNVYLLLYLVIILKEIIAMFFITWQRGSLNRRLFYDYWEMPTDKVMDAFSQESRGYVVSGVVAIIAIRIFAAAHSRFTQDEADCKRIA